MCAEKNSVVIFDKGLSKKGIELFKKDRVLSKSVLYTLLFTYILFLNLGRRQKMKKLKKPYQSSSWV